MQRIAGPGGIRLLAPERKDGHADRFWALALAAGAAEGGAHRYAYRPVKGDDPRAAPPSRRRRRDRAGGRWAAWIGGSAAGAFR